MRLWNTVNYGYVKLLPVRTCSYAVIMTTRVSKVAFSIYLVYQDLLSCTGSGHFTHRTLSTVMQYNLPVSESVPCVSLHRQVYIE